MLFDHSSTSAFGAGKLRILFSGKDHLLVENHEGILEYTDTRLVLRVERGRLSVAGNSLEISEYGCRDIVVSGGIKALEFLE